MADGLVWDRNPSQAAHNLDAWANAVPGVLTGILSKPIDTATQDMRSRISGLPRIRTGDMYTSISGKVMGATANGAKAQWGYLNNPPFYTTYQEYGTSRISAAHAFVDASETLRNNVGDALEARVWEGLKL